LKERIDVLLVKRGLVPSREKAQAFLMAGSVLVDGQTELKQGTKVSEDALIELKKDPVPYVSRGGLKLEAALDHWGLAPDGLVCVDIGASTGGFTDLLLQRGARKVYAIDVGYGQLDFRLRNDPRVVNMERVNVRYLEPGAISDAADFISVDVSFISLRLVLPVAARLLKRATDAGESGTGIDVVSGTGLCGGPIACGESAHPCVIVLVKPQFEAERGQVGKGGIVRDESVRREVVEKVKGYAAENGLHAAGVIESPIRGTKGNVEYLMRLVFAEAESDSGESAACPRNVEGTERE
jgi:23S rRNA (cytidine1920-2'-O)/16S rRNA (cytidine1409-2'-O)-methyltransferase